MLIFLDVIVYFHILNIYLEVCLLIVNINVDIIFVLKILLITFFKSFFIFCFGKYFNIILYSLTFFNFKRKNI